MKAEMPHWSHSARQTFWLQQSPVRVSLERKLHVLQKLILTFPVLSGKKVLTHVVLLVYFLYQFWAMSGTNFTSIYYFKKKDLLI